MEPARPFRLKTCTTRLLRSAPAPARLRRHLGIQASLDSLSRLDRERRGEVHRYSCASTNADNEVSAAVYVRADEEMGRFGGDCHYSCASSGVYRHAVRREISMTVNVRADECAVNRGDHP